MRDPNRLEDFYGQMKEIHIKYFPELRFGQLMSNFFGWLMVERKRDLFFPEEDEMMRHFEDYAKTHSQWS